MASSEPAGSVLDSADRLFAQRSALAASPSSTATRPGIHHLVDFLKDRNASLSPELQQALFADRRLRDDFVALKQLFEVADLPALAAASDGSVSERRLQNGLVRIHPSRIADQVYVIIEFTSAVQPSPTMLILAAPSGEIMKWPVPQADESGAIVIICDTKREADVSFLRLLRDPATVGSFLA